MDFVGAIAVWLTLTKAPIFSSIGFPLAIFLVGKGIFSLATNEKSLFAAITDITCAAIIMLSAMSIFVHYIVVLLFGMFLLIKSIQSLLPEVLN